MLLELIFFRSDFFVFLIWYFHKFSQNRWQVHHLSTSFIFLVIHSSLNIDQLSPCSFNYTLCWVSNYSTFCLSFMLKVNRNHFQLFHSCTSIIILTTQEFYNQLSLSHCILIFFLNFSSYFKLCKFSSIHTLHFVGCYRETKSYDATYYYLLFCIVKIRRFNQPNLMNYFIKTTTK